MPLCSFNESRFVYEQSEGKSEGLGPTYMRSCAASHQSVATGGASQIAELRRRVAQRPGRVKRNCSGRDETRHGVQA